MELPRRARDSPSAIQEIRTAFGALWTNAASRPLTDDTIATYRARRKTPVVAVVPGSADPEEGAPDPTSIQIHALEALRQSREHGFRRALVVMATGLGKTYLAAFDAKNFGAAKVLFVAHREEILGQAARTFSRVFPGRRVGLYTGAERERDADLMFASVQTLSRTAHLESFREDHFDYIVVDEFHHAAARTYRRVIDRFTPTFLFGLTATPDRTDAADIRALCDQNEVFAFNLFDAVTDGALCPFTYYGISDTTVAYEEIPWRNGQFDPETLENKLATISRANHAYREWSEKKQSRTLAFCVSRTHADFMADRFAERGVRAVSVHGESQMDRSRALHLLAHGEIDVIFSVDLFSEGVDLPAIDTILMLRPTDSRIMFLQQLGRGLRKADGKERLVILDFIGNHRSFLTKPQALFGVEPATAALLAFVRDYESGNLELPAGCFVNLDLKVVDFLKAFHSGGSLAEYESLRDALGRRPTLLEYYRSGASLQRLRTEHGDWFALVRDAGDLTPAEARAYAAHQSFLAELETTSMTKVFKMIALEAFLDLDGLAAPPKLAVLADASLELFRRRRYLIPDLATSVSNVDSVSPSAFLSYWNSNPINAWTGGNLADQSAAHFQITDGAFTYRHPVIEADREPLADLMREIVELRIARYADRPTTPIDQPSLAAEPAPDYDAHAVAELPFFPNLPIACGHFRAGTATPDEHRTVRAAGLDLSRPLFISRAAGDSMSRGERPVHDGDTLLFEYLPAGSTPAPGEIVVIEREPDVPAPDASESPERAYLLRQWQPLHGGEVSLVASNPAYEPITLAPGMRAVARMRRSVDPLEPKVGTSFMREEIPPLFGAEFNPGNWNSGHVSLPGANALVLLVTLNKQGKAAEHRYVDRWEDARTFVWQSQRSTKAADKKGREIIDHEANGTSVHLFVRDRKLGPDGTAAAFVYEGRVRYLGHEGSGPMTVRWGVV